MPKRTPTIKQIHVKTVELYEKFLRLSPKGKAKILAKLQEMIAVEKDAEIKELLQSLMAILQKAADRSEAQDKR